MQWIVQVFDRSGIVMFYTGAGVYSRNISGAFPFNNRGAATRTALALIHGEPGAFWESERQSAARTRAAHIGWKARAVPLPYAGAA